MMIRRIGASAVLLAALFLAGCARDAAVGTMPATAPVPSATSSPAPPVDALTPSPDASKPTGTQTLTGTIVAGVEPNCLLLDGPAGSHLLILKDPRVRAAATVGASVTIVGQAQPDVLSTCQQGVPFLVSEVRAD